MRIAAILDCINSKADRAGNCYWAFRWTDTRTGKQVTGRISGGESNISCIPQFMVCLATGIKDSRSIYTTRHEFPYREFITRTHEFPYAGSQPEELAVFIHKGLKRRRTKCQP